jgi:hypothetical protein
MAIFPGPAAIAGEVKSPKPVNAFRPSTGAGPLGSYRARPKPPAARVKAEAYPSRLRKSRRFHSAVFDLSSGNSDANFLPLIFAPVVKVPLFKGGFRGIIERLMIIPPAPL